MAKQTLYMDYSSSKSLQIFLQFLIGNGKINEEMYYYLFGDRDISDDEKNLCLHRHYRNFYKILSMLTLYDEIVIVPIKDYERINEEILEELGVHYQKKESRVRKILKKKSYVTAEEVKKIVYNHQKEILADYMQEKSYYDYWPNYHFDLTDSLKWYLDHDYHIENKTYSFVGRYPQHLLKSGEYYFMGYLDGTVAGLVNSLCDSEGTFYSCLFSDNSKNRIEISDLEKVDNFVLALDFAGGLGVVPCPEKISEVIEWRKNSDMKAFRAVFSDWIHTLRRGDISLACKIQLDVKKANEKIRSIEKYEKLDKNVFVAFIKTLLSQVPEMGILMDISDYITPYVTDYQKSKNSWVNLPAFNSNYSIFKTLKRKNRD